MTEVSDFIAETTDDFSHDHFELLNLILAHKLTMLEGSLHCWPFGNFCFSIMKCLMLLQKQMTIFLTIILSY